MEKLIRWYILVFLFCSNLVAAQEKNNVLFIAVDDLNDWVGCLGGHPQTVTPHIDKLAAQGIIFTNAHCQAPICGPSRASIMTGLYPSTTGNYLQVNDLDIKKSNEEAANSVFLPDFFEQYGYKTMGVGKIYHNGDAAETFDTYGGIFEKFGPKPVARMNYDPKWLGKPGNTQTDWGPFPESDAQMPDYKSAEWAIDRLEEEHGQPFFLAVGFVRPHVPWHVPKKWFDKFPVEEMITPPYLESDFDDLPVMARQVNNAPMMPTTEWVIETGQWKEVVQAYLACVNFVDAQIGKVLDALDQSKYKDNTIIVLWSDHGYHLGEKNRFAKQSLWMRDSKTLLAFRYPGGRPGTRCGQPVELVDIYPTLADLCSLPLESQVDGNSLVPLMEDPGKEWKHQALSFFGLNNVAVTGSDFRLIQYEDGTYELYDLKNDPFEWNNLADQRGTKMQYRRLKKAIPVHQAPYSEYLRFNLNPYFQSKEPQGN